MREDSFESCHEIGGEGHIIADFRIRAFQGMKNPLVNGFGAQGEGCRRSFRSQSLNLFIIFPAVAACLRVDVFFKNFESVCTKLRKNRSRFNQTDLHSGSI